MSSGSFLKTYKNPEKTKFKSQDRKKKKKEGKDARKKTLLLLFSHRILLLLACSGNGYGSDDHYSDSAKNLKKTKRDSKRSKKENNPLWAWQWKRGRGVAVASVWGRECCLSQATAMKEEL
jgi:hypothetical protein